MARTTIPAKIQNALWARAGGRCQYRGCNDFLVGDLISGRHSGTYGFIAHIVADIGDRLESKAPRYDPLRSPLLAKDIGNLMIMCHKHHKLIDVEAVEEHPETVLLQMKKEHEERVELNTGIGADRASHVLRFGASIGTLPALVDTSAIFAAMPPDRHPAVNTTIDLQMKNHAAQDHEVGFYETERANLERLFAQRVTERVESEDLKHLSVFALAPQPLLFELGRLLNEIVDVTVHQFHRNPKGWAWARDAEPLEFELHEPEGNRGRPVAVKLAVSANIDDQRILSALSAEDAAIWTVTVREPHNDVVRQPEDVANFAKTIRRAYARIQEVHGVDTTVNMFPAVPVSLAVEAGRVWMPKINPALRLFDQVRNRGFVEAFSIGA